MTTTTIQRDAEPQEPPALTAADRFALALGAQLTLRAERHRVLRGERVVRADQASIARSATSADRASITTFEHRTSAGPRW